MKLVPHHIALKVVDISSCAAFYTDILRLPKVAEHKNSTGDIRSVWLNCGNLILMLEKTKSACKSPRLDIDESPAGWHLLALEIKSSERGQWKEKLVSSGVEIIRESEYSIYFHDPEKNILALTHYPNT